MLAVGAALFSLAVQLNHDPAELLAVAYTESRWEIGAVGPRESVGPLQINCRAWWTHFKFDSEDQCRVFLSRDVRLNTEISVYILRRYRNRYPQCSGDNVFACYNGGPGWRRLSQAAQRRVLFYQKQVTERRELIRPIINQPIEVIWKALRQHETNSNLSR